MSSVLVVPADHREAQVAERLHRVQRLAYAQEAELLGVVDFPPLRRTVESVRTCREEFFVATVDGEMAGALGVELEGEGRTIASLVVAPQFQRRGVASALLAEVLRRYGAAELMVQTGAGNQPALRLYERAGFVEIRRWIVGPEALELVRLRRPPSIAGNVAAPPG